MKFSNENKKRHEEKEHIEQNIVSAIDSPHLNFSKLCLITEVEIVTGLCDYK
jgi:hypothetical protein